MALLNPSLHCLLAQHIPRKPHEAFPRCFPLRPISIGDPLYLDFNTPKIGDLPYYAIAHTTCFAKITVLKALTFLWVSDPVRGQPKGNSSCHGFSKGTPKNMNLYLLDTSKNIYSGF